ncbi:hypothetical protein K9B35_03565 [Sphingomonas sp. R647]|uniref:hypothetical protein n=1 Tax=Sphingomonas sp. R647 TaxID=2875233 RepID=UPI001CD6C91D|nr:hypothetical protein [Sphingomonas sp. R647]MCA1197034.1 hypothetical protein [Sphingomonas sp. R647]
MLLPLWFMLLASPAQAQSCPTQFLPPAIDSTALPALSPFVFALEFAATPSREYPGDAWVIRVSRQNVRSDARLAIVHLRRQITCNRYDIIATWDQALPASDYLRLAQEIAPYSDGPRDVAVQRDPTQGMTLDGTELVLRAQGPGWKVERTLNIGDRVGPDVGMPFHRLAQRLVPPEAMPDAEWRRRGR